MVNAGLDNNNNEQNEQRRHFAGRVERNQILFECGGGSCIECTSLVSYKMTYGRIISLTMRRYCCHAVVSGHAFQPRPSSLVTLPSCLAILQVIMFLPEGGRYLSPMQPTASQSHIRSLAHPHTLSKSFGTSHPFHVSPVHHHTLLRDSRLTCVFATRLNASIASLMVCGWSHLDGSSRAGGAGMS